MLGNCLRFVCVFVFVFELGFGNTRRMICASPRSWELFLQFYASWISIWIYKLLAYYNSFASLHFALDRVVSVFVFLLVRIEVLICFIALRIWSGNVRNSFYFFVTFRILWVLIGASVLSLYYPQRNQFRLIIIYTNQPRIIINMHRLRNSLSILLWFLSLRLICIFPFICSLYSASTYENYWIL